MNTFPDDVWRYISLMPFHWNNSTFYLKGNIAGVAVKYSLAGIGKPLGVLECDALVGGLSGSVRHGSFLFDRDRQGFLIHNENTLHFVKMLPYGDYLTANHRNMVT